MTNEQVEPWPDY